MAANAAIIIDKTTGIPLMVVVPDNDAQLQDPSFHPPNSTQILIPMNAYRISTTDQLSAIVSQATSTLAIS